MSGTLFDLHIPLADDHTEQLAFLNDCPGWAVYLHLAALTDPDATTTTMLSVRSRLLVRFATTGGRITVHEAHHADPAQTGHPAPPTDRLETAVNESGHQAAVSPRLLSPPPTVDQVRRVLATAARPDEPAPVARRPCPPRRRPRRTAPGPGPTRPHSRRR